MLSFAAVLGWRQIVFINTEDKMRGHYENIIKNR